MKSNKIMMPFVVLLALTGCAPDGTVIVPDVPQAQSGSNPPYKGDEANPVITPEIADGDSLPHEDAVESNDPKEESANPLPQAPAPLPLPDVVAPTVPTSTPVQAPSPTAGITPAAIANGYYLIKRTASNHCLDVPASNASDLVLLIAYECTGSNNQVFYIELISDGLYKITNRQTTKSLHGRALAANSKLVQNTFSGIDNQLFFFEQKASGQYVIRMKGTNLPLEVINTVTPQASNLQFASPLADSNNQIWVLQKN